MRKISEILTIARRYHGASHGLTQEQTSRHPTMFWGLCLALSHAHVHGDITWGECRAARDHIRDHVTQTYLHDELNTRCPHEISSWWDNHIARLIELGE